MFTTRLAACMLLFVYASPSATLAHGTERHFDTVINGRGGPIPSFGSGGSPAFTLMLIESSARALLKAAVKAQPDVARKQASRLSELVDQLRRRSKGFDLLNRERFAESTAAIAQSVHQIGVAAKAVDTAALRLEVGELDRLVTSMQGFLRESAQP